MKDRKYSVIDITAAAAFAMVLGISSIWGLKEQGNVPGRNGAAVLREAADSADMGMDSADGASGSMDGGNAGAGRMAGRSGSGVDGNGAGGDGSGAAGKAAGADGNGMAGMTAGADGGAAGEAAPVVLDERQLITVSDIMKALEKGNLKEAAAVMVREEDMLADMFYTVMDGGRYLYDGSSFRSDIDGRGMVFTKAGTVYYGTFKAGKPEGQCTALQVVDLDAPRYDYSQGIWKDGRMEGKGHTGYCYFEGSPEGEARDICKTGTFSQDLMEGDVVYTSMNEEDQVSTWKLKAGHGIAILDNRWNHVESTGEYQLLSEDNDNHAYVLEEDQAAMPMWVNLLVWDE
ncbi:hypothetical protein LK536_09045 [Lachnoclostridium pacaense]|uniref:hypothetical protein n=1 Tax=Enterocloster hominis (ex Hitch et al. 2024) TaxID=1917870 RepID=UPI001D0FF578|nr:hypothetical protein [Lachnoclostridium pacaense]MCC2876414.1 hypothetical protein [Lachnoclostridium pacaense]